MNLELNYKQAMALLDLVKTAKTEANIKAYSLQAKFKGELTEDAKAYWAEQQDKQNSDYDFYGTLLEQLRDVTGEI